MKRVITVMAMMMAGVLLTAAPVLGADAQYIGNSTATTTPDIGPNAMNSLCDATFKGSRMCTSEEIVETFSPPVIVETDSEAWVQPVFAGMDATDNTNVRVVERSSGIIGRVERGGLNCFGWTDNDNDLAGLVVNKETGTIVTDQCDETHNVACCVPLKGGKSK